MSCIPHLWVCEEATARKISNKCYDINVIEILMISYGDRIGLMRNFV